MTAASSISRGSPRTDRSAPMSAVSPAAPSPRECGDCTLCCKIMGIRELNKPPGSWCSHCKPARGCAIYERRPQECRSFVCGYLHSPDLDERWKPSFCKFLLMDDAGDTHIVV